MVKMIKLKKEPAAKTETVSFKVSPELSARMKKLMKDSADAGYRVELNEDFSKWLNRQLGTIETVLKQAKGK